MKSMGTMLASVALGCVLGAPAQAQTEESPLAQGRVELSTAASFHAFDDGASDETATILNLPARVGWFATRQVELEGELALTRFSGGDESETGIRGTGRVLYHFGGNERVAPFVFAGVGVGNAVELVNLAVDSEQTVTHWEAGAGIKVFAGRRAALRLDYRFARFSSDDEGGRFSSGDGSTLNIHRVFAGLSLFFH
jgi:hypothetical protein